MIKIIGFIKRHYIFMTVIVLASVGAIYLIFGREKESPYSFIIAEKGSLVQEVSVTGRIKPAQDVNLAFEKTGKIAGIYVVVGERVYQGKLLTQLNNLDVLAQFEGAQATLKAQQAKLDELKKGTRPEEIQVQEVKVANAKTAVMETQQNLSDKLQDAYTKSDDAIRNKVDQFFNNPRSDNPKLSFQPSSEQTKTDMEWGRLIIEDMFDLWELMLDSDDLDSLTVITKKNLNQVKSFLDQSAVAVSELSSTYDSWKTDVSTSRTNINTAIVNLSSAEEELSATMSALSLAEQELNLKQAGSVPEQILAQEAQVEKAQADVKKYQADLSKTVIRAPIGGVVTKQDANVGEIISANTSIISIISEANYEIEANVPEIDVAKLEIGNSAEVTLDAYGSGVIFKARIIEIDPAETVLEGVAIYKIKLQFVRDDDRIKSGMTANVDILTGERDDVIIIPQRAVITENGDKKVRVIQLVDGSETVEEKKVKTGLKGSDGNIEILEGLLGGEKIVTFIKTK